MAAPFVENIDLDMLEDFQEKTKYDLKAFFESYVNFYNNNSQNILDFYEGETEELDAPSFKILDNLIIEVNRVVNIFQNNSSLLSNYRYWVLLDNVEDVKNNLLHFNNASRWTRSAIVTSSYNVKPQITQTTRQNQVLEGLLEEAGSADEQNDWVDTAIENALREEDYDTKGGDTIKIFLRNNRSFFITSVVDNMTLDTIYGKDIDQQFF